MFTGIIEDIGQIKSVTPTNNGRKLSISSKLVEKVNLGDSIAVNGVCLTVTHKNKSNFSVDVSFETLNRTNIGLLKNGSFVNIERALKLNDRLNGHLVMGHVDTTATIQQIKRAGEFFILTLNIDQYTFNYSVEKGSICVNGISLTIANITKESIDMAIVPFTFEHTNLKYAKPKEKVNIEVDIIGKYVEKILKTQSTITLDFLKDHGFI